jgi:hypothetical protein
LKSAIPVAKKGCDGTPSRQFPPELLRASGQDTVLMNDLHARMEFTVWTPVEGEVPKIVAYDIEADNEPLLRASQRKSGLCVDRMNTKHEVVQRIIRAVIESWTTTESIKPGEMDAVMHIMDGIITDLALCTGTFLPEGIVGEKETLGDKLRQQMLFPIGKGSRAEDLTSAFQFYVPRMIDELVQGLHKASTKELERTKYLGPLRSYPPRHFAFSHGYAWDVVRREGSVRKQVNAWLSAENRLQTPYELQIRHLLTIDDLGDQFWENVRDIENKFVGAGKYEDTEFGGDLFGEEIPQALEKLKEHESKLSTVQELILYDLRSNTAVSHRDVGIGISQVLPVLVSAYAFRNKIVAIEQPEIHLHPALQAELGDVFIQSALGDQKNTFVLETHSEHLILRIMRRIRETTQKKNKSTTAIRPDDVSLLFVGGGSKGSTVQELRISNQGQLLDRCPGGFFEEDFEELF